MATDIHDWLDEIIQPSGTCERVVENSKKRARRLDRKRDAVRIVLECVGRT
jgi:hypothetical protein